MLKTLVLLIVGTFLLANVVVYVVRVVLPFIGSLPGYIYLFFDWAVFYIKQATQYTLMRVDNLFNWYVGIFYGLASFWILYTTAKILFKFAKYGPGGMAVGLALAAIFLGSATYFVWRVGTQVSLGKQKIEDYINEVEGLIEKSFNPIPYWMYSHVVTRKNTTLGEYLKGIFRSYFYSKQKEVFRGKIASITFVGNHTCNEIERTVSFAFNETVRRDAFLLFNCTGSGEGNFSIEIFSVSYYITFNISSNDPNVPDTLKDVISYDILKEENGISNFDNYTCYIDASVDNFIANVTNGYDNSELYLMISPFIYCEVWIGEDNLKYKVYIFSEKFLSYFLPLELPVVPPAPSLSLVPLLQSSNQNSQSLTGIRNYLMERVRNNVVLEGITANYARMKRIYNYKVIPPKLYYEILGFTSSERKDIFINYYLSKKRLEYLVIIAKKV